MIYHNGKRYLRMKNGQPYEEAYSSLTPANIQEIQTYLANHEGETVIAENGEDWIFKFEPFPENIIQYIKQNKHPMELRYSYRGGHIAYGVRWMYELSSEHPEPDEERKTVTLYKRKGFYDMKIPAVDKWKGNIGYLSVICSPKKNLIGEYPIAVKVTVQDLRRGSITLPKAMIFHNTRLRPFYMPPTGKLALVFKPECIHKNMADEYGVFGAFWETAIMESKTIVSKPRNGLDKYKQQDVAWTVLNNSCNAGGTRTKTHRITFIRNDPAQYNDTNCCWIAECGSGTLNGNPSFNATNYAEGSYVEWSSIKFHLYSTSLRKVRIKSDVMGWDFHVLREPIQSENGTGASSYITPTIGLTQDIPDLQIIIEE